MVKATDGSKAPDLSDDLRSELELCTRLIGRGGERIDEIVRNLNRLTATTRSEVATCNLREVLASSLKLLSPELKGPEIIIERDIPESIALPLSPSEVSQVLMNLLTNACQAMPSGGILKVIAAEVKEKVVIDIIDNGTGIDEAHRPHIFDPFFTTREQGLGKGLGLSLSLQVVKDSGGELYLVEDAPDTHFRVILPSSLAS